MAVTTRTTVVGVFPTREQAQRAIAELQRAGFREADIGVAARESEDDESIVPPSGETLAAEGAVAGATAGAGVGALWGIGIALGVLPAIGPALAGGLLATIVSSATAGAAAAGLAGAMIGLGIPEEEASFYEGEFHSGRVIVTVRAADRHDAARAILVSNGSYDAGHSLSSSARPEPRPRPR